MYEVPAQETPAKMAPQLGEPAKADAVQFVLKVVMVYGCVQFKGRPEPDSLWRRLVAREGEYVPTRTSKLEFHEPPVAGVWVCTYRRSNVGLVPIAVEPS